MIVLLCFSRRDSLPMAESCHDETQDSSTVLKREESIYVMARDYVTILGRVS